MGHDCGSRCSWFPLREAAGGRRRSAAGPPPPVRGTADDDGPRRWRRSRSSKARCTSPAWTSSSSQLDGNVVLAKTITDRAGQADFPDVPAGRYLIRASSPGIRADGFAAVRRARRRRRRASCSTSALTYIAEASKSARRRRQRRASSPCRPATCCPDRSSTSRRSQGDDFQSLLPLLPGVIRGTGRPASREGRPADAGRAANQQHEPHRSIDRRFRSRASGPEPRVGRAAGEPVLGRVRPVFDERHADSHAARDERVGGQARQPRPAVLQGTLAAFAASNRGSPCAGPSRRDRVFIAQDIQFRYVNDPVKRLPGEPDLQLTSFDSFTRIDGAVSPRHTLGGLIVMFPRKLEHADDEHVPSAGSHARIQPERRLVRRRRIGSRCRAHGAREHGRGAAGSRST